MFTNEFKDESAKLVTDGGLSKHDVCLMVTLGH
jgi:hypothetical protein